MGFFQKFPKIHSFFFFLKGTVIDFPPAGSLPKGGYQPGLGKVVMPGIRKSIRSPVWVAGTQVLEPSSAAFQDAIAGSRIGSGVAGTGTGTLIWNAGILSGSLTCCATTATTPVSS